jgi:hypothetical protein
MRRVRRGHDAGDGVPEGVAHRGVGVLAAAQAFEPVLQVGIEGRGPF